MSTPRSLLRFLGIVVRTKLMRTASIHTIARVVSYAAVFKLVSALLHMLVLLLVPLHPHVYTNVTSAWLLTMAGKSVKRSQWNQSSSSEAAAEDVAVDAVVAVDAERFLSGVPGLAICPSVSSAPWVVASVATLSVRTAMHPWPKVIISRMMLSQMLRVSSSIMRLRTMR